MSDNLTVSFETTKRPLQKKTSTHCHLLLTVISQG